MLARTHTAGLMGIDGFVVRVESDVGLGLRSLIMLGQDCGPFDAVRLRVRAALAHCGHVLPPGKRIVCLAPAEERKENPGIDLAIACALLMSHGVIPASPLAGVLLWAELGPTGRLLPAPGALVVADLATRHGFRRLVLAPESTNDALRIGGLEIMPVDDLAMLVAHLRGELTLDLADRRARVEPERNPAPALDMADVRGLELPRLAVEVMVAGGHHLLLHGPSGSGKTMLASRVAGLLPELDYARALEVAKIHDAHATGFEWTRRPPVRIPSPTVSATGLLGGEGQPMRPGEFSLAHGGVLVLDELPNFADDCLAKLRLPLDDGVVMLTRHRATSRWPARFLVLATMRSCPCGSPDHALRACSKAAVRRYQAKISGPLLDRMDLVVPVDPPPATWTSDPSDPSEPSSAIRARILVARERARRRLHNTPWTSNAEIPASGCAIEQLCPVVPDVERLLADFTQRRSMSTREMYRMRRVAQTIADLDVERDPSKPLEVEHFALAARLRRLPHTRTDD